MKKLPLLLLCFCMPGLYVLETKALNLDPSFIERKTVDLPPDYDEIVLKGSLMLNAGPNAFDAGVNENSVYIRFNQNLGYVSVTIINPYGWTIYNDVVNTAVQQVLVVPISFTAEGIYTIILDNADDNAEGDFVKD